MKKILLTILLVITVLTLSLAITGCSEEKALSFDKDSIEVDVGSTGSSITLVYGDSEVKDFEKVNFSFSNEGIVTIKNGKFIPVAEGLTYVTASYENTTAKVSVSVARKDGKTPTISLSKSNYSVTKNESVTLDAAIIYDGVTYTDATFSYKVSNAQYGSMVGSTFKASSTDGNVTVEVSGFWRGVELGTSTIYIDVEKYTIVDKSDSLCYYVDQDGIKFTKNQLIDIFGNEDTIKGVKVEAYSGEEAVNQYGTIKILNAKPSLDTKLPLVIEGSSSKVRVSVYCVTKIIDEAKDLLIFKKRVDGATDSQANSYTTYKYMNVFNGVYIVTQDINANGLTGFDDVGLKEEIDIKVFDTEVGLTGVFDGLGHTISNLKTGDGGLFGIINGGTFRNIAFTNLQGKGAMNGSFGSYIAVIVSASSRIENCYFSIPNPSSNVNYVFAKVLTDTVVKNVYIEGEVMGAIPFYMTIYTGGTTPVDACLFYTNVTAFSSFRGVVLVSSRPFTFFHYRSDHGRYYYADFENATYANYPAPSVANAVNYPYFLINSSIARYSSTKDLFSGYEINKYGTDAVNTLVESEYFAYEGSMKKGDAKITWTGSKTI